MSRMDAIDYLPAEVQQLNRYKPLWYLAAALLVLLSALAVVGLVATRDTPLWLGWIANIFQAAQVTLTLFLVILTYNLFAAASHVSEQNERIHRISQLPIVVAEIKPLSFDPYPSYQLQITNEGSGPAVDIDLTIDYHLKKPVQVADGDAVAEHVSEARLRIGVMNKSSHTGQLLVDARGIMMAKPWKQLDVARTGLPTRTETETLLDPYALVVRITYKDIYSQEGRTTYEALQAAGDLGMELTELVAPPVHTGTDVKPISFRRAGPLTTIRNKAEAARS